MKFLLFAAALAAPALAMPEPVQTEGGVSLSPRDLPKLNQYASMDDWQVYPTLPDPTRHGDDD
jgi:hypothetical protein